MSFEIGGVALEARGVAPSSLMSFPLACSLCAMTSLDASTQYVFPEVHSVSPEVYSVSPEVYSVSPEVYSVSPEVHSVSP